MTRSQYAVLICVVPCALGFAPDLKQPKQKSHQLFMVPRFDPSNQKWYPTEPEDTDGYPPIGSLIRQGPTSFFQRLVNSEEYEQSVYKYRAIEQVSRKEAQGNMDAYLENPNDWLYQKSQERKGAAKYDYANANTDPKQLVLTGIWGVFISYVGSKIVYELVTQYWLN